VKYLKWLFVLVGASPFLFATGLYTLYFNYREQSPFEISPSVRAGLAGQFTGIISIVAFLSLFINLVLLLYLVFTGYRRKQIPVGYIILYLAGAAVMIYIYRFDNYHALSWYLG
jgi:hypothetical protein